MSHRQKNAKEAAGLMVKRYGTAALRQIDQRIEELCRHGEAENVAL